MSFYKYIKLIAVIKFSFLLSNEIIIYIILYIKVKISNMVQNNFNSY